MFSFSSIYRNLGLMKKYVSVSTKTLSRNVGLTTSIATLLPEALCAAILRNGITDH